MSILWIVTSTQHALAYLITLVSHPHVSLDLHLVCTHTSCTQSCPFLTMRQAPGMHQHILLSPMHPGVVICASHALISHAPTSTWHAPGHFTQTYALRLLSSDPHFA